jgi:hypothetical protein
MKSVIGIAEGKRTLASLLFLTFGLAAVLTLFYFVHEQSPRLIRAPSAWLLAPVAIVDGLCYAVGVPGIYGKALPIFLVNSVFAAAFCGIAHVVRRWWRR